ncbi:2OG-Fe(II) oxygenase [Thiosocius teredinicola]|uniref:2OG-Fe(II) oxygenase n=1 Tax=Thiosocius teredinicola TaxID=1973002 RepID=UPI002FE4604D
MAALLSTFDPGDGDVFTRIADAIECDGYTVIDGALPTELVERLFLKVNGFDDEAMTHAGIGREDEHQLNRFVRSDETRWIDRTDPSGGEFLRWMEQLRQGLNRRLFLGLFDYEAHFARYAPGAFYKKHRDAFADGTTNRVLSTVLYLNPQWAHDDGGEMLLYADDDTDLLETVTPTFGRLVVFLSERFPHEVLAPQRTRYSIAGWFRVNNSIAGMIDPPR